MSGCVSRRGGRVGGLGVVGLMGEREGECGVEEGMDGVLLNSPCGLTVWTLLPKWGSCFLSAKLTSSERTRCAPQH